DPRRYQAGPVHWWAAIGVVGGLATGALAFAVALGRTGRRLPGLAALALGVAMGMAALIGSAEDALALPGSLSARGGIELVQVIAAVGALASGTWLLRLRRRGGRDGRDGRERSPTPRGLAVAVAVPSVAVCGVLLYLLGFAAFLLGPAVWAQ